MNVVAGSSATVIAKQVGFTIGKELIIDKGVDFASSNITNFDTEKFNLNKTTSTILNMGLSFGIQKGVDAIDMKISGPPSFAEGMSYNDAKRYNERNTKLESGEYTGYPGLSDADVKAWQFADSKLNEHIAISKVDPNEVVNIRMKEIELQNKQKSIDSGGNKSANNVPDASIRKQQSIIKSVEDGSVKLETNIQKGNYGEMKMDNYFESQGYQRISNNRVIDLNEPTHRGIDGVYYKPDGHPPYVIAEAKYGKSKLANARDGMQMSDTWIRGSDRLIEAVGKDIADDILLEGYSKMVVNDLSDGTLKIKNLD